jgi:starch phosphorylase
MCGVHTVPDETRVAYFSMELALSGEIPTYAGGLGILAGDTVRAGADLGVPMTAVTLLHRQGYFHQHLDAQGRQSEEPVSWSVEDFLEPLEPRVEVEIEGRTVALRVWRYSVTGGRGAEVPVYLLDTDLPENDERDRALSGSLYRGDERYRLCQEVLLGIGGLRMLRALGYERLQRYHLNEGHAGLVALALLEEMLDGQRDMRGRRHRPLSAIRAHCVFTTHTPVPAGHDIFPADLVRDVLGEERATLLEAFGQRDTLNLTDLALRSSRFVNGVAMRHGEVSRQMFSGYPIRSITNGIHPPTWATPPFEALFDHHIPDWKSDPVSLRYAVRIPLAEIGEAHRSAKRQLIDRINRECEAGFDEKTLTIGFARRATAYKRPTLIFHNVERLARLAERRGPLQLVFAGKAHPRDDQGKASIREIFAVRDALRGRVGIAYLANHDMDLGRLLCGGCDVWLNTPLPPLEASGTSGMKAALNGVPSLSVLDGWWLEGHVENVTGWAIGQDVGPKQPASPMITGAHAAALYDKLEKTICPCFYRDAEQFLAIMRSTIAVNGSFFNTQRMMLEYLYEAYYGDPGTTPLPAPRQGS